MTEHLKKFVWDTSAIINIKEPDRHGYSPGHSLIKDLSDGWIPGPYQNIFPSLAVFEVAATVSRKHREGSKMLREFYLMNEHSRLYDVDQDLIDRSYELLARPGFSMLRGSDLVFACIAALEDAYLVTLDGAFSKYVSDFVKVLDLRESRDSARYRNVFSI
jgi:hypothetical protein